MCLVPVLPRDQEVLSECNTIPLCFTHLLLEEREEAMPRKPGEKYASAKKRISDSKRKAQYQEYDYFNRNEETRAKYNSTAWRKCRASYISRHPVCEECEKQGLTVMAREVHHRVPLSEGGSLLAESNLQSLCHKCHMGIHGFKGSGYTDINVVYGPPCSGKSTWVEQRLNKGDFVWDLDKILSAVSGQPIHSPVGAGVLSISLSMRDTVIEEIRKRSCRLNRVWIIITDPSRLRVILHGATFWRVEAPIDVCLERAIKANRSEEVLDVIRKWFDVQGAMPGDRRVTP